VTDAPSRPGGSASGARRWGPLAVWVTVLLVATSWPSPRLPDVQGGDKVVHALLYGVLAFLAWRAATPPGAIGSTGRLGRIVLVLAAASAFGWADEWHQQFIPGRSRDTADWQADTAGALLGVLLAAASATLHRPETT